MTDRQAELERVARKYTDKFCAWRMPSMPPYKRECLQAVFVEALAAREAEVLEEAAGYIEGGRFLHDDAPDARLAKAAAAMLRRKAKERRP